LSIAALAITAFVRSYHLGFRHFTFLSLSFVAYHWRALVALPVVSFRFILLPPPFWYFPQQQQQPQTQNPARERERGRRASCIAQCAWDGGGGDGAGIFAA
jgi:hypothetical protein